MRAPGWAAAALLVLLPSVGEAQRADPGALADARRGIDRGNAQYIAAFGRADADGVAEVYDADGVRLNEDGTVLRGRQAIAGDVRALLDQAGPVKVVLRTGKPEQTIGGRYVTTWKRQADGGWKIKSDVGVPGA